MNAETLGRELRTDNGFTMRRRRQIAGLALFNIASMGAIVLYQIGTLKHVPVNPPLPGFDADRVNGSAQAYEILQTPDAALGLGSYAVTLALVCLGEPERAESKPWVPLLLAAKATSDALLAAKLTVDQPLRHKAWSFLSLTTSCATFAIAALTFPEARSAWHRLAH